MKYVVENFEEDFGPWVQLEYKHMATLVGDSLVISNIDGEKKKLLDTSVPTDSRHAWELGFEPARVCLLDLRGDSTLCPEDSKNFDAVVFGGILGDHPPRDRTGALRQHGFGRRQLGTRQMTTDTAVLVCHMILDRGMRLDEIPFIDDPEIKTGEKEVVEMPFRYVKDGKGEPILAPGMKECLADDGGDDDFF
eukprot:comp20529_c0_seq1/m.26313 comp20529_c0_seq1/g.26313  ORF comp20529_c0_seq1/g.26313 comp20529_c0_seq1/m.26313 type:complete len:193 (-) comp20529_c0_seq1:244-822(-)